MWKYLACAAALTLAGAAYAQDAELVFNALDANRDGSVSQAEAQPNQIVMQAFAEADTDRNGSLSRDEFLAAFGGN